MIEGRYIVETDVCDKEVGASFLQRQPDGPLEPIRYCSRSLTKAKRSYKRTELEWLAVVWALLLLHPYLEGSRFTVRTDHSALQWLPNLVHTSGKLARWRLRLSNWEFDVINQPGVKHQAADALLPIGIQGLEDSAIFENVPFLSIEYSLPVSLNGTDKL